MKLLVLHSELGVLRGGGENFTRNLFTAFSERGHEIYAAFVADRRGRYPIPLPPAITAIPITGWWSRNLGQTSISFVRRYLPSGEKWQHRWDRIQQAASWRAISWHDSRFRRRIERDFARSWQAFDAVYVHSSATLASQIAQHRPVILRLPGPISAEFAPSLRRVHAVCANGDALECIREFLGDHAIELPIGIDTVCFSPVGPSVKSQLGWKETDHVIGFVGRLTHLKGVDLLATAFREISPTLPTSKLLIVGSGPAESYVRSVLVEELSRGTVHIQPDVDHQRLPYWYRAMDLFVIASRYENFSNAMLEAMACGIPYVASDIGGNRIAAAAKTGWLFESESASSLAACIRSVVPDVAELKARGAAACCYARKYRTWSASAARLESILTSRLGVTNTNGNPGVCSCGDSVS